MIRNLLILIFLSVTFFASAQRHITVVELASTGSATHETLRHVYSGNDDFDMGYSSQYERRSTDVYSLSLSPAPGVFTYDGNSYVIDVPFLQNTQQTFARLGRYGRFLLPNLNTVSQDDVLNISPYQILIDNGWIAGLGVSAGNRWNYNIENCDYSYQVAINGAGFLVHELHPSYSQPLAFVALDELPDERWIAIPTSSSYASTEISAGFEFTNLAQIIEAVNNRAAVVCTTIPEPECTEVSASYEDLNELVVAANAGFYTNSFIPASWTDRFGSENRWNIIEIEGDKFVLEIDTGSEGHVGTRTYYRCLEELLDNLPQ